MMKERLIQMVIFFCFTLISCENEVPINDIDLSVEPKIVLYGGATPNNIWFYLYYSHSVISNENFKFLDNVESYVFENGVLQESLIRIIDSSLLDVGYYFFEFKYCDSSIRVDNNYALKIFVPGYGSLYANATIPEYISIKMVEAVYLFKDEYGYHYKITFDVDDPRDEVNYYTLNIETIDVHGHSYVSFNYPGATSQNFYSFSDKILKNNQFSIELIEYSFSGERVKNTLVRFYQIDSTEYLNGQTSKFQYQMNKNDEFFAFEPVNIYSNVINGYGSFVGISENYRDTFNLKELFPDIK